MRPSRLTALALLSFVPCAIAQSPADSVTAIDRKLIVDCRLPPQVRKLGLGVITQMPGRIVKVSKIECETRSGLYVLYDAADPKTALTIWLDSAKQGDANAQNRVGQIYELGIGTAPDYAEAAKWYRAAVASGSRAAAINLATLYDQGLGVAKSPQASTDLYRKAQAPAAPAPVSAADKQMAADLAKSQQRVRELEEQLAAAKAPTPTVATAEPSRAGSRGPRNDSTDFLDVGADAGSRPFITILDPNVPVTRGISEVRVRGEVRTKDIIGRVRAKAGLERLAINDRAVEADRFGFFSSAIAVGREATPVVVTAVARDGQRADLSFVVRPGADDAVVPPPRSNVASGDFGAYYALVIGNRRYTAKGIDELRNAETDARSIAAVLEQRYGFRKPRLLINATHDQILDALNDFAVSLTPSDNLVIYYAGHGTFDLGKRGYWIPVDSAVERNTRWISNIQITDLIQKMNARKVIVVSDSCYAGALTAAENGAIATIRVGGSEDQELLAEKQLALARSRTVMGSGGLAPVLEGGGGDHSVFTRALLEVLEQNSGPLEGYRLFVALEARVLRAAQRNNFDQAPVYAAIQHAGHEGGDFVFLPSR